MEVYLPAGPYNPTVSWLMHIVLINFLTTKFILIILVLCLAYSSGYSMSYRSLKLVESLVVAEYVKITLENFYFHIFAHNFFKTLDQFHWVARRIG
jgi:hypothetical protein